ncbi:transposable element Tcb1 transposase [Trichonephila clavipes]|nr:transposable element Tcb1 transposase [Trichonephila clavipes]
MNWQTSCLCVPLLRRSSENLYRDSIYDKPTWSSTPVQAPTPVPEIRTSPQTTERRKRKEKKSRKPRSWHPSPYVSEDEDDQLTREEKKAKIKAEIARRRQQIEENMMLHEELCKLAERRDRIEAVISRRKQQSAFDQVSKFDRGRIVSYRDCGYSFREIGSRVGRNQTTVIRICDHWMQEGMTARRGRSHPPQCTTSREDRQIVREAVTDRSVASRTIAQHIESVTHHSVSARTIRCRLQQSGLSARRPLLGLPLTQNHRRLRYQSVDERRMWAAFLGVAFTVAGNVYSFQM